MPDREDITAVLDRHLAVGGLRRLPREALRRLLTAMGRPSGSPDTRTEARSLVEPLGLRAPGVNDELALLLEHAQAAGLHFEHAEPVTQAYVRALGRIVEAEVAHLRALLHDVEPDRHAQTLDRVLPALLSAAVGGFDAIHRALLHAALSDELVFDEHGPDDTTLTVALVDLSGSTIYLQDASPVATQELVDGLFHAGQTATSDRRVRIVKYVGDGFFLAGRDAVEVVAAAAAAVRQINAELPLSARAGVAAGPVLRRAGDLFGLPVNLAQLLTKRAAPRTVLVTAAVAAELDPATCGEPERVPGPAGRDVEVVVVTSAPDAPDAAAPGR